MAGVLFVFISFVIFTRPRHPCRTAVQIHTLGGQRLGQTREQIAPRLIGIVQQGKLPEGRLRGPQHRAATEGLSLLLLQSRNMQGQCLQLLQNGRLNGFVRTTHEYRDPV